MKKLSSRLFLLLLFWSFISVVLTGVVVFVCKSYDLSDLTTVIISVLTFVLISILMYLFIKKYTLKLAKPLNEIDLSNENYLNIYQELKPFEQKVKDRQVKLKKQMLGIKREYKIQDNVRKEFTANVSHELKTPLTSISGYAEILKNGMVKDEDISRFSGKIYNEAQRLITLVDDIIKLSRLDENAIEEQKQRIELYSLCENIIARLETSAEKKDIKIELIGQKTEIDGIERIIDEIIYNLCDNAIKYNRQGGKVTLNIMQTTTNVIVSVSDNGIGIDKEDIPRIFERFYRVNKSHSREIGGTGLGLSIVKHGLLVHNAEIEVDSQVGEGTAFTIKFPI